MQGWKVRLFSAIAAAVVLAGAARASEPVPRTVTGCVRKGTLWSESYGRAYPLRVRKAIGGRDVSLAAHEGKRIRIVDGLLLPGDIYIARSPATVIGPCRK